MSGELEAAGAAATAGLVAGAIEGRTPHGAVSGACANCDAALQGPFCHACGQAAHPHRSLVHMIEEFVHGILHFDTKAWRTLPLLVFRPGTLTRNYVYGKRARYISPLALFLFTIFFMFFVFAFVPAPVDVNANAEGAQSAAADELRQTRDEAAAALEQARAARDPNAAPSVQEQIAQRQVDAANAAIAQLEGGDAATADPDVEIDSNWQQSVRDLAQSENFVIIDGWDSFNEHIRKKLENPDLLLYKIQQTAYKFSFLLVPISLPFIALLFLWKRGVTLYDHTVFALYSLSFAALVFVFVTLSERAPVLNSLAGLVLVFGMPVHTFFHLGGAYALGWFSALWRTVLMLIFACISLLIFLITIVLVGLTG